MPNIHNHTRSKCEKKPIFQGDHRQNMDIVWNPRVPRPRDNTVESKSVPLSFCGHWIIQCRRCPAPSSPTRFSLCCV